MILNTAILLDRLVFPESLRWHDDKLWFSDVYDHKVMTVDIAGHSETVVRFPGLPSGLGWLPNNQFVIVSIMDQALLQLDQERLVSIADLRNLESGSSNELVVSRQGWAYVGAMGFAPFEDEPSTQGKIILTDEPYAQGKIIQVTVGGTAQVVADQLEFPNGMVITPDGHALIVAETWGECLTAFDITSDGSLVNRRIWAQIKGYNPDGICLDAEGAIWVAAFGSTDVLRVCEGGEITHRARVANTPVACMLGGVDRRTLFVATISSNQPEDAIARRSGCIETVRVEVAGAGLP